MDRQQWLKEHANLGYVIKIMAEIKSILTAESFTIDVRSIAESDYSGPSRDGMRGASGGTYSVSRRVVVWVADGKEYTSRDWRHETAVRQGLQGVRSVLLSTNLANVRDLLPLLHIDDSRRNELLSELEDLTQKVQHFESEFAMRCHQKSEEIARVESAFKAMNKYDLSVTDSIRRAKHLLEGQYRVLPDISGAQEELDKIYKIHPTLRPTDELSPSSKTEDDLVSLTLLVQTALDKYPHVGDGLRQMLQVALSARETDKVFGAKVLHDDVRILNLKRIVPLLDSLQIIDEAMKAHFTVCPICGSSWGQNGKCQGDHEGKIDFQQGYTIVSRLTVDNKVIAEVVCPPRNPHHYEAPVTCLVTYPLAKFAKGSDIPIDMQYDGSVIVAKLSYTEDNRRDPGIELKKAKQITELNNKINSLISERKSLSTLTVEGKRYLTLLESKLSEGAWLYLTFEDVIILGTHTDGREVFFVKPDAVDIGVEWLFEVAGDAGDEVTLSPLVSAQEVRTKNSELESVMARIAQIDRELSKKRHELSMLK